MPGLEELIQQKKQASYSEHSRLQNLAEQIRQEVLGGTPEHFAELFEGAPHEAMLTIAPLFDRERFARTGCDDIHACVLKTNPKNAEAWFAYLKKTGTEPIKPVDTGSETALVLYHKHGFLDPKLLDPAVAYTHSFRHRDSNNYTTVTSLNFHHYLVVAGMKKALEHFAKARALPDGSKLVRVGKHWLNARGLAENGGWLEEYDRITRDAGIVIKDKRKAKVAPGGGVKAVAVSEKTANNASKRKAADSKIKKKLLHVSSGSEDEYLPAEGENKKRKAEDSDNSDFDYDVQDSDEEALALTVLAFGHRVGSVKDPQPLAKRPKKAAE